jgi:hypothetical protein
MRSWSWVDGPAQLLPSGFGHADQGNGGRCYDDAIGQGRGSIERSLGGATIHRAVADPISPSLTLGKITSSGVTDQRGTDDTAALAQSFAGKAEVKV